MRAVVITGIMARLPRALVMVDTGLRVVAVVVGVVVSGSGVDVGVGTNCCGIDGCGDLVVVVVVVVERRN